MRLVRGAAFVVVCVSAILGVVAVVRGDQYLGRGPVLALDRRGRLRGRRRGHWGARRRGRRRPGVARCRRRRRRDRLVRRGVVHDRVGASPASLSIRLHGREGGSGDGGGGDGRALGRRQPRAPSAVFRLHVRAALVRARQRVLRVVRHGDLLALEDLRSSHQVQVDRALLDLVLHLSRIHQRNGIKHVMILSSTHTKKKRLPLRSAGKIATRTGLHFRSSCRRRTCRCGRPTPHRP